MEGALPGASRPSPLSLYRNREIFGNRKVRRYLERFRKGMDVVRLNTSSGLVHFLH
jgi:hypothetical protein